MNGSERAVATHRVYIDDPFLREAARRTLGSARARLASSGCARLLEELSNERDEPLTTVLASLRVTPTRYLEWLIFQDGSAHRQCDDEGVLAFTTPGSRVIYLCGRAFCNAWRAKPDCCIPWGSARIRRPVGNQFDGQPTLLAVRASIPNRSPTPAFSRSRGK